MSAFLGPIHVAMYGRVLGQDEISRALLALAEEKGWTDGLRSAADAKAPAASAEPLEEIIDPANIHGWLSAVVAVCERRLALIAGGLLLGHPERLDEMQGVMKDLGRGQGLPPLTDAERAFEEIHGRLLDGMPCDFPFDVTESGADAVVWRVAACPHAPFWAAEGLGAETYYRLRDAWIEGALEGGGIVHTRADGIHALRRER